MPEPWVASGSVQTGLILTICRTTLKMRFTGRTPL